MNRIIREVSAELGVVAEVGESETGIQFAVVVLDAPADLGEPDQCFQRGVGGQEDHYDRVPNIEFVLQERGDLEKLELVRHASNLADIHYVRQGDPKGLGHAVLRSRQHVGDEPFAVLPICDGYSGEYLAYAASKAAVETFTKGLGKEVGL